MGKFDGIDDKTKEKSELFLKQLNSDMCFKSSFVGNSMSFDWVDQIEVACPYIDNVIRNPKLTLIREENIVKVEKAKKITVASIKDLSRHTNFISKLDKKTKDVQPSKILDVRNEETLNIYENRFLYTLIDTLNRFLFSKEEILNNFEILDNKILEYAATSSNGEDDVSIELKIVSNGLPRESKDKSLKKEIDSVKMRVKRIREYITSWQRSEMMKALDKEHISLVNPPIKKTNIILKNPNFQVALNLWNFLQKYNSDENDNAKDNANNNGNDNLREYLDHSFLTNYFVLDSISSSKREEKEKLLKYSIYALTKEIYRTLSLLQKNGIKMDEEELLSILAQEMKNEKSDRLIGANDVKKKFQNAMDEYLERIQDYL